VPLLIGEIIRVVLNILLDWVLIFGKFGFPESGINGAALATVISTYAGTLVNLILLFAYKKHFRLSLKGIFKPDFAISLRCLKLGLPIIFEYSVANMVPIIILFFINKLSPIYAGVFGIWNTLILFPGYFNIGNGMAAISLIGKAKGAGHWKQGRLISHVVMAYCLFVTAIVSLVYIIFSNQIMRIFSQDYNIYRYSNLMMVLCLTLFPRVINAISGNAIKSYGHTSWMLVSQVTGVVLLTGALYYFIMVLHLGIVSVLWAMLLDEMIRGILNLGKWEFLSLKKSSAVLGE